MFSGLVKIQGIVIRNDKRFFEVSAHTGMVRKGDSIAVNGVCLTAVKISGGGDNTRLLFEVSPETLNRTTIGSLPLKSAVNVEKALTMADSLGGHLVQGHVDGVGRVARIEQEGDMKTIWFAAPADVAPYLVEKGSVAIDGVSLTVANLKENEFSVAFIPHTLEHTTMGRLREGDRVNMEADVIAKYVFKYSRLGPKP